MPGGLKINYLFYLFICDLMNEKTKILEYTNYCFKFFWGIFGTVGAVMLKLDKQDLFKEHV